MVEELILIELELGLTECQLLSFAIEMFFDWFDTLKALMFWILINKLDDSSNHVCLLNTAAQNVVFGVVLVHPHLNNALFIDCNMLLLDLKETNHFAKDLKSPQALVVHM